MKHLIAHVEAGSLAENLGIMPGDLLVNINGREVNDWLDYQAFTCVEDMSLVTERDGEETEYLFQKDEYEPLGLSFDTELMSKTRECVNHCVFCFVDQLPENARDSLKVKDDDWRLSLMMGNFVTLTNVSDAELDRIIERHASPLYISVHATNGRLRKQMIGCPRADKLISQLNKLRQGGIRFHAQAVICPGVNDGEALEETISDLSQFYPDCMSLAIVPVGLTKYKNPDIHPFSAEEAQRALKICEKWRARMYKKHGTQFVFPSDEFYLLAEKELPPEETYEDYAQIENGVGLYRLLEMELDMAYDQARLSDARPGKVLIATGVSAAPLMQKLCSAHPLPGVDVEILPIVNRFFGETVTVAGLITGGDLKNALQGKTADRILITECMLREGENVFLDGVTLEDVQNSVSCPVIPVGRRGEDLLNALAGADIGG